MAHTYSFPHPKFVLGDVSVTVATQLVVSPDDICKALTRHIQGDWGDVCEDDRAENELSLAEGFRLFSVYHGSNGVKFWIITERDRSATTVLLPDDY